MNTQSIQEDERLNARLLLSNLNFCSSGSKGSPEEGHDEITVENSAHVIRPVTTVITPPTVLAFDVNLAAIHESGHFVIAEHYGVDCRIELTNELTEIGDTYREYTTVKGKLFYPNTTNRFTLSVIAWGGLLAEIAVDEKITDAESLAIETREQFDGDQLSVSHSDSDIIFKHTQPWRALKAAARIVVARRARIDEITQLALRHMIDEKQMRFNYPPLADHVST